VRRKCGWEVRERMGVVACVVFNAETQRSLGD
jgi:hypothetical protein